MCERNLLLGFLYHNNYITKAMPINIYHEQLVLSSETSSSPTPAWTTNDVNTQILLILRTNLKRSSLEIHLLYVQSTIS